jgi:thymidylate synthase ThyX
MPINNDLPDLKNPVPNRRHEKPRSEFKNHLDKIEVKLLNSPTVDDLLDYIPRWCLATWSDKPHDAYTTQEKWKVIEDLFEGKVLPSALETIGFVFLVSNIDLVDVTHLLRHRTMSFSAICSADRDLRHDDILVKPSIACHKDFYKRYQKIVRDAKQLYADMVDYDDISMLDARTVLPRCMEHHYYCRVNFKDLLNFVRQRIDRQIQPESDNIVALKMWIEVCKVFPFAKGLVDLDAPDQFYCKVAPTGRSSNIYMPEVPRNDIFEYKYNWFIYKRQRWQMLGGHVFVRIWKALRKMLEEV